MATKTARVERELILLRIPVLPLAAAVGTIMGVFFFAVTVFGGATALRSIDREVPWTEALQMTLVLPAIAGLTGFIKGFVPTAISTWFLNLLLHLLGGVRFVVAEPAPSAAVAPTGTEPPTTAW